MNDVARVFMEGGWAMYPVLALGLIAWFFAALTTVALIFKRTPMFLGLPGLFALLTGGLAVLIGFVGYFLGMSNLETALEMAAPTTVELLRVEGTRMAKYPMYAGLLAGGVPMLDGIVAVALAFKGTQDSASR